MVWVWLFSCLGLRCCYCWFYGFLFVIFVDFVGFGLRLADACVVFACVMLI